MSRITRRSFVAASTLGASTVGLSLPAWAKWQTEPDLILHNAAVWTVSDRVQQAQALAISDGRILALGTDAEMLALATARTKKIDLGGKRVTPGFYDAHAHPVMMGVLHLRQLALELDSIDAIKSAIRERAQKTPRGEWIIGFLYDDGATPRPITRQDLDEAAPDHPVIVRHRGGHTVFANSQAFRLAGVTESTPNPEHGEFFRDASGKLNGRVGESAADKFNQLADYKPTREDNRKAATLISKMLTSYGITSVCDALGDPSTVQGAQDARDAGELHMRIYSHIQAAQLDHFIAAGVHTGFGDDWVRLGAVKLFSDGSISERTAWLSEPYEGQGDFHGIQTMSREQIYEVARKAHLGGWQVGIHGNGDLAIDRVLGVFEQLQKEAPKRSPRFRIEHCTLLNADLIRRIKAVGAIPITFGGYVYFHGKVMHFYGEERTRHMFALRDLLDAGLRPASSSDYSASPPIPMLWLQSQVTRTDPKGNVWGANQRITLPEAIRCGTVNSAYASFDEQSKGSLEPGKLADLVVWDQDMLKTDPSELVKIKPQRTMVGGRWVYES